MPSVKAYLVVHQYNRRVERYARFEDDVWRYADITGPDPFTTISCPETELSLDEIDRGTDLPT